jgi:hypothetical protein
VVTTPNVKGILSPERGRGGDSAKHEKPVPVEMVKPEKLVLKQDTRFRKLVGEEGYKVVCKVGMPLQNQRMLPIDDKVWTGVGALFTPVKVKKDSMNNRQHNTVVVPKDAYLMVAPADAGEEPSSRVVFIPGTKSCPYMLAGDSRKYLYFCNLEKEVSEYDTTQTPVPMAVHNLGMTYPTDFPNACAFKLEPAYMVKEMQRRAVEAQVVVQKALKRLGLRTVYVAPVAGVFDEVPDMVRKLVPEEDMIYVSMDCLPMGEVVGTHKLMLKHTYVTDGLVKEVKRVKDGDVMILVGMPPHHREEEMVTKMEKEFDVGMLVLTPEMAKRKVQGWSQMVRFKMPEGSFKAWGMRDRYSTAHTQPLAGTFMRQLVVYMKDNVVVELEARGEEGERKQAKEASKGGTKRKEQAKAEEEGSSKKKKVQAEQEEEEWGMMEDGYRSFSWATGEVYEWKEDQWQVIEGEDAFKSPVAKPKAVGGKQGSKEAKKGEGKKGGKRKQERQEQKKTKKKKGRQLVGRLVATPTRLAQAKKSTAVVLKGSD